MTRSGRTNEPVTDITPLSISHRLFILLLIFGSGMAGLIYQVLWMKQLGLLFGNTAQATSSTLAAFFAGLAVGSWYWGRRASRRNNPLLLYALLELGIGLTALLYFVILPVFYWVYPGAYQSLPPGVLPAIKFALAMLLIFPPAFCMGGTVPAIAQYLVTDRARFGRTSALIYGVNTFGAAIGVVSAAFVLIPSWGFRTSYGIAVGLSVAIGVVTWLLSRGAARPLPEPASTLTDKPAARAKPAAKAKPAAQEQTAATESRGYSPIAIGVMCFVSGFAVLCLEVLWTRMFAQIHSNSVYAFAIMLTVVLVGLALGAAISWLLAMLKTPPASTLAILVTLGGVALVFGPHMFMAATDNMQPLTAHESWGRYVRRLFEMGFAGIGIVVVVLGTVFPYIMKIEERQAKQPGSALGGLLGINTLGSILGALACGFVLLPWLGMWATMKWITALYLAAGMIIPRGWRPTANVFRAACMFMLVVLFTHADPTTLPATSTLPGFGDKVLETWEGADCSVAVTEDARGNLAIKINSAYTLGSTAAFLDQVNQSHVAMAAFPETRRIFFLGVGTGVSAGAALHYPNVEKIISCELTPEVITAAKKYMPEKMLNGVFTDPRSTILIEDGRHYLRFTNEKFDMINADLFLPYRRGAGSLYSLDHYLAAKERLTPNGVYVQWLPLFQLTELEFGIISRTMLEAFGQVTMWRNNFTPGHEIVALVGQVQPGPIAAPPFSAPPEMLAAMQRQDQRAMAPLMSLPEASSMFFYAGNLTRAKALFEDYGINTDDRPLIEYQTPRTWRANAGQRVIWYVGPKIADMVDAIFRRSPVEDDPALANFPPAKRRLALAGAAFHRSVVYKAMRRFGESEEQWEIFIKEVAGAIRPGSGTGDE